MKEKVNVYSEKVEHFGVPWKFNIKRNGQNLGIYLYCLINKTEKWRIEANRDLKLVAVTGKVLSRNLTNPYGNSEESTIEGILNLADIYDAKLAIRKCEEFLMESSEKTLKEYLTLAHREPEDHFGVPWKLQVSKKSDFLALELFCLYSENDEKWSIQSIDTEFKIVTFSGKSHLKKCNLSFDEKKRLDGLTEFIKWDEMIKDYCIDDHLIVEVDNFLELLHGESPIDESTIEGIVHLADMCDAKLAIRKCEEFLIENSGKTLKEKLKLAHRYNLVNLKNKCLSKITTAAEIRSVLSHDTNEMDPSVVGALLQKSLTLIP
ncbi:unnamed protein product [Caenorhabditis nigoni]